MSYSKVGWKDFPDTTTPINASNLDHMDSQIKNNADDLEIVKPDVADLKDKAEDLQDQINEKLVSIDNGEWINNMLEPTTSSQRIGSYNSGPLYQINYFVEVDNNHQSQYEFDIADIVGYDPDDQSKGHITGISGVISCSDGKVYPVGYNYNNVMFLVVTDEEYKKLTCMFPGTAAGTNVQRKRTIMLTVNYRKYYP